MNYEQALQHIFKTEGGYSNDKTDRGGATNFGISSKAYPGLDVSKLTKEEAAAIYKRDYWDKIDADNLPEDVRLIAFDTAVNHGPKAAVDMIRAANFDPNGILEQRKTKYAKIIENDPSQAKFANGRSNRLASLSPKQVEAGNKGVAKEVAQDNSQGRQLQALRDAGNSEWIDAALKQGWPTEAIINELAPEGVAAGQAALERSNQRGIVGRTVDSVKDRASDYAMAGRQLESKITGNTEELAREQAEQKTKQEDLDRIARSGNLGGIAADIALSAPLALVPGGLALKTAVMAAGNAAQAGTYADEDGKMWDPTTMAVGGLVVPAAVGAGKVLQKTIGGAKKAATDIGTRPARVAAARGEEIGTVKGWAAQDMGIDPAKAATMSAQEISEAGVNNARRLLENSMEGVTAKVDDDILAAVNKQRGAAGLDLVDGANVSMRDLDGLRRLISSEVRTSSNQFTKDGLKPLEEKISKAIEENFAQHPDKYNQFLTGKKYYDNWRVYDNVVRNTNNIETELLNPTKWSSAMKSSARSRFSRGDAPMQNVLDRLQEAKGQSALVKGGTAKALEFIGNAAEWVPGIGIPARLMRHTRMAKTIVDSLSDPVVRAAFQRDLPPSVQAQIYKAAATPTAQAAPAAVAPASVLKQSVAAKQAAPLRLGYEPPKPPVIAVDSAGRASADDAALFNAKYAPQAADPLPTSAVAAEDVVTAPVAPQSVLPQATKAVEAPVAVKAVEPVVEAAPIVEPVKEAKVLKKSANPKRKNEPTPEEIEASKAKMQQWKDEYKHSTTNNKDESVWDLYNRLPDEHIAKLKAKDPKSAGYANLETSTPLVDRKTAEQIFGHEISDSQYHSINQVIRNDAQVIKGRAEREQFRRPIQEIVDDVVDHIVIREKLSPKNEAIIRDYFRKSDLLDAIEKHREIRFFVKDNSLEARDKLPSTGMKFDTKGVALSDKDKEAIMKAREDILRDAVWDSNDKAYISSRIAQITKARAEEAEKKKASVLAKAKVAAPPK